MKSLYIEIICVIFNSYLSLYIRCLFILSPFKNRISYKFHRYYRSQKGEIFEKNFYNTKISFDIAIKLTTVDANADP